MIAVSNPDLRPEFGAKVVKYSQHGIDLLDLDANEFVTRDLAEVLDGGDYPNLHLLVSRFQEGYLMHPYGTDCSGPANDLVLTYQHLITRTSFVVTFGQILATLEEAYGHPVDIEFTATVEADGAAKINLVQCRPLQLPGTLKPVGFPSVDAGKVLFRANRMINGGMISPISHIVYIDPKRYSSLHNPLVKKALGGLVGRDPKHPDLADSAVLTMGPGRWGKQQHRSGGECQLRGHQQDAGVSRRNA